jgi:hypothetical protein
MFNLQNDRVSVSKSDAVRWIWASVLALAGALKWLQLADGPVGNAAAISIWLDVLAIAAELSLSVWIVSGIYASAARRVALMSFGVFAVVSLDKALSGDLSCGCFGRATISPWLTLLFDFAALATLAALPAARPQGPVSPSPGVVSWSGIAARVLALACVGFLAVVIDSVWLAPDPVEVLEPQTWIGLKFPLLDRIDIGPEIAKGRWTVVLIRHDCSECQQAIAQFQRIASELAVGPTAARIALIDVERRPGGSVISAPDCYVGRVDDKRELFVETPLALSLQDGIVQRVGGAE